MSNDVMKPGEESAIAEMERRAGLTRREVFDQILEERYRSVEQMALALGIDVALAKRILADPIAHENAIKVFIRSAQVELDLIEVPTLLGIIKTPDTSPSQKRKAATRLRKILESPDKKGPTVQVNTQINQHFPDGSIESAIKKIDGK